MPPGFICYHPKTPVVLSCKVSLRRQYKQGRPGEGVAIRQVYRRAKTHLITTNSAEAASAQSKIEEGDITGLDSCMMVDDSAFDDLINRLSGMSFQLAGDISPIKKIGRVFPVSSM